MKKILLATTVLVGTAGFAAAEVTLSGSAVMGVGGDGDTTVSKMETYVTFTGAGETDGGLSFGLSSTMATYSVEDGSFADDGTSVFISGAFGKLSMGDVVGAAEAVVGDLPEIGYTDIANNDTAFIAGDGFNGTAPAVLYTYSAGDLTVALGASDGVGGFVGPMVLLAGLEGATADEITLYKGLVAAGCRHGVGDGRRAVLHLQCRRADARAAQDQVSIDDANLVSDHNIGVAQRASGDINAIKQRRRADHIGVGIAGHA